MQIPSYQIQNVLKVYSRQLSQGKILNKNKFANANKISADSVTISPEGKRQAIIDKVALNIVNRIITEGPKEKTEEKVTRQIEKELGKKNNFTKEKNQFTYTKIDENNQKIIHTLSVENSKFIIQRMTELAREIADSKHRVEPNHF
ncbi:MAG: DVU0524 family FlgM-associated protein [Thermodesulfobacteriota bacterium]